jgi:hypothetical protein
LGWPAGGHPDISPFQMIGRSLRITVGQQMGNTTVKTSQRYSTMTCDENAVN